MPNRNPLAVARRRRDNPEQRMQMMVASYLHHALPYGGPVFWTAVNPVPGKSEAAARFSKSMGMRAGVPDLLFVFEGRASWIEMKAGRGRANDFQNAACADIERAGCRNYAICRSVEDVDATLRGWGFPMRARLHGWAA